MDIVVKQVKTNSPMFDVFTGEGWNNWSRVFWDSKKKRLNLVSGERLNPFELKATYDLVESLLHGTANKKEISQ